MKKPTTQENNPSAPTAVRSSDLLSGVELIAQERARQIGKGYTPESDQIHFAGQLAKASVCYTLRPHERESQGDVKMPYHWPWYGSEKQWKPSLTGKIPERIQELAKAGALIAAEIDRLKLVKQAR